MLKLFGLCMLEFIDDEDSFGKTHTFGLLQRPQLSEWMS